MSVDQIEIGNASRNATVDVIGMSCEDRHARRLFAQTPAIASRLSDRRDPNTPDLRPGLLHVTASRFNFAAMRR